MEYNAFTEGVRPGSVTTSHEVIILICYVMREAGRPVTFEQLNGALQSQQLVNYFEFAGAMESMQKSGHIRPREYEGEPGFCLTELGQKTASTFEDILPPAVRERGRAAIVKMLTLLRRQEENRVTVEKTQDGYAITMTITDIGSDLMSLRMFMPTEKDCEPIRRRFLNDPMLIYKGVFALLTGDMQTVGELVDSRENLFEDESD